LKAQKEFVMNGEQAIDFDGSNDIYEAEANRMETTYHCGCCHNEFRAEDLNTMGSLEKIESYNAEFGTVYCDACNPGSCRCEVLYEIYPITCFDACTHERCEGETLNRDRAREYDMVGWKEEEA
jgi:hypothetical protein